MAVVIPLVLLAAGWITGTLVNYLADQLPVLEKLTAPVCPRCNSRVSWGKYLTLDRCKTCASRRSVRNFLVQFFFPVLAIVLWQFPYPRLPFVLIYLLIVYFGLVAVIDWEHRLIMLSISLVGLLIGLAAGWVLHGVGASLLGGAAGTVVMLGLYWLGRLFSRLVEKRRGESVDEEALGFGDVYISAVIGLVLGWPGITAGLLLGILIGGLISGGFMLVMLIARKYRPLTALPYAPFLIAAAIILLLRPS